MESRALEGGGHVAFLDALLGGVSVPLQKLQQKPYARMVLAFLVQSGSVSVFLMVTSHKVLKSAVVAVVAGAPTGLVLQ